MSVALVAVIVLGLPLAYLSAKFVRDDARSQLQRSADLVLVAGKGHETYQEIKGVKMPFDDREELRTALSVPKK